MPRGEIESEGTIGEVSVRCVVRRLGSAWSSAFAVGMLRDIKKKAVKGVDYTITLTSSGAERKALVHVPPPSAERGARRLPLMVNLHTLAEDGRKEESLSGMSDLADLEGLTFSISASPTACPLRGCVPVLKTTASERRSF